jgi:hypothetical protein
LTSVGSFFALTPLYQYIQPIPRRVLIASKALRSGAIRSYDNIRNEANGFCDEDTFSAVVTIKPFEHAYRIAYQWFSNKSPSTEGLRNSDACKGFFKMLEGITDREGI